MFNPSNQSWLYAGGLVGWGTNMNISNSYAITTGDIASYSTFSNAFSGGLVGRSDSSSISNSYAITTGNIFTFGKWERDDC